MSTTRQSKVAFYAPELSENHSGNEAPAAFEANLSLALLGEQQPDPHLQRRTNMNIKRTLAEILSLLAF